VAVDVAGLQVLGGTALDAGVAIALKHLVAQLDVLAPVVTLRRRALVEVVPRLVLHAPDNATPRAGLGRRPGHQPQPPATIRAVLAISSLLILIGLCLEVGGALLALAPDLLPKVSEIERLFEWSHGRQTAHSGVKGWLVAHVNWDDDMAAARRRAGAGLLVSGFVLQAIGVLVGLLLT